MGKFNKSNFPLLFATVSKVLGEEEAEKQLSIAYESLGDVGLGLEDVGNLWGAFFWNDTAQGHDYWEDICNDIGVSINE